MHGVGTGSVATGTQPRTYLYTFTALGVGSGGSYVYSRCSRGGHFAVTLGYGNLFIHGNPHTVHDTKWHTATG